MRELEAQASSLPRLAMNPAGGLLQAMEQRATTALDVAMTKHAFRLTCAGHREWMLDMNQIMGMRAELPEEQVGFAGRVYAKRDETAKKAAVFVLYLRDGFERKQIEECMREYFAGVSIVPRHDDWSMWLELSRRGNPLGASWAAWGGFW
jgi:hypothetical protein